MTNQVVGTLKSINAKLVEYVKKCERCSGPMIVTKDEITTKHIHDLCR